MLLRKLLFSVFIILTIFSVSCSDKDEVVDLLLEEEEEPISEGDTTSTKEDEVELPVKSDTLIFEEKNGIVAAEAEHFYKQEKTDLREWFVSDKINKNDLPDNSLETASNNKFIQILPDTRVTHADELKVGVNFTNTPGELAIISYKVKFNKTGRYYVWVRALSTGSEDNGIHVGMDGKWPESGKRMQWCEGRKKWTWTSKQRTIEEHCGIPYAIYLDVETAGVHDVHFSMREDGFRFDKFLLTQDSLYVPIGNGIDEVVED
ncbi:hypothetical protein [Flammeovirga sp. OC4]|uniref:hypothetical protein n=1 Tax=Flammeovirga sp. OC4 TaxID=1382345 RepID=UPI00155DCE8D|nr:hypothetical protein [Flammeovirga sp. OC4]